MVSFLSRGVARNAPIIEFLADLSMIRIPCIWSDIITNSSRTIYDNGIATAAEFGVYTQDGEWIIEGHGVDTDIVVDNLPYATYQGKNAQLDTTIDFLKKKMLEVPVIVPETPGLPDKSFEYKKWFWIE
jgi:tricorn protease